MSTPTDEQLIKQYGFWGSHPDHAELEWQDEFINGKTRLGYWRWVESQLADAEEP